MRKLSPAEQCEAKITRETVQQPVSRILFDLSGRKVDLGADTVERPGIEKITVICARCSLSEIREAEESGPYGSYNAATGEAREIIRTQCQKLGEIGCADMNEYRFTEIARQVHPGL